MHPDLLNPYKGSVKASALWDLSPVASNAKIVGAAHELQDLQGLVGLQWLWVDSGLAV